MTVSLQARGEGETRGREEREGQEEASRVAVMAF